MELYERIIKFKRSLMTVDFSLQINRLAIVLYVNKKKPTYIYYVFPYVGFKLQIC